MGHTTGVGKKKIVKAFLTVFTELDSDFEIYFARVIVSDFIAGGTTLVVTVVIVAVEGR